MDIEAKFKEKYSKHLANFKTLSRDSTNDKSLCQNTTHRYYNFDDIVEERNCKPTPSSPDALIFKDNKIYCVEFKNSFREGIKNKKIKKKLKNGYEVLSKIFKELDLQRKDYRLIFCVVHKGFDETKTETEKKQRKRRRREMETKTETEKKQRKRRWREMHDKIKDERIIQFDLKQFKGVYFDDIVTNDVDFFRGQFIEKINLNIDLPC